MNVFSAFLAVMRMIIEHTHLLLSKIIHGNIITIMIQFTFRDELKYSSFGDFPESCKVIDISKSPVK